MAFFEKLKNGWHLGMTSLEIIKDHKKLAVFPLISTIALIIVVSSFFSGLFLMAGVGLGWENIGQVFENEYLNYLLLFLMYLISYFVIVFFNVGLVYCARKAFRDEEFSVSDGLRFSLTRLDAIFFWSLLAATVGMILKTIEERVGFLGKIVMGLIGMVWSLAIFFVVPIIAYENVGPIEAVKRSGHIMKEKWGETLGANFGFAAFYIVGYLMIILTVVLISLATHVLVGIGLGILLAFILHAVVSAANMVFVAATYQHLNGEPNGNFDGELLDSVFLSK